MNDYGGTGMIMNRRVYGVTSVDLYHCYLQLDTPFVLGFSQSHKAEAIDRHPHLAP